MMVWIEKLSAVENPSYPSGSLLTYRHGFVNTDVSLPIGYWLLGSLMKEIEVGSPMKVHRTLRNGVKAFGVFETSGVVRIEGDRVWTANSMYRIFRICGDGLPSVSAPDSATASG